MTTHFPVLLQKSLCRDTFFFGGTNMNKNQPKFLTPDYTSDFQCIAGKCRHSCCIGWEIDINDETWDRYQSVPGKIGEKLSAFIAPPEKDCPAHFILQEQERCPFLNKQNLCELILTLGEDSLCDICREHPRFYNRIGGNLEMGFGLCCEEASRLLFARKDPIRLLSSDLSDPAGEGSSDPAEEGAFEPDKDGSSFDPLLLTFREDVFSLLQDRTKTLQDRISAIRARFSLPEGPADIPFWGAFFETLERLDPAWGKEIDRLKNEHADLSSFRAFMEKEDRTAEYENFLWYLFYRHLASSYDEDSFATYLQICILFLYILEHLGACRLSESGSFSKEEQIELARMFSSEIEYSDENIERITDLLLERELIL